MIPYYDDETCVIYHADCREVVLPRLRDLVVVTDPPYGVAFEGKAWKENQNRSSGGYIGMDDPQIGPDFLGELVGR